MDFRTDVVIVGTGVAGTFSALNLPKDKNIIMITKSDLESSDSFLAQVGICVLTDENDYDNYFEDTMKAGHYENRKESVDIMIRSLLMTVINFFIQEKGHIPDQEFFFTRISQDRRLRASFLHR